MNERRDTWWPTALLFLGLAALWLLPLLRHPNSIAFWPGAGFSDLLLAHWPNALFAHQAIQSWGEIPLWNPNQLSGMPFAADPLSGIWYPPNWLAIAFPTAWSFNLLFWLHLAWAGLGAYKLARTQGLGFVGSLVAGIVFGGTPKFIAHIALGHLGLVSAVSWTPWFLLALMHAVRPGRGIGRVHARLWIPAGLSLGIIFLADPRWVIPAGMMGALLSFREASGTGGLWALRVLCLGLLVGVIAAGVAAGPALPLQELASRALRAGLTPAERAVFSLPPSALLGLFRFAPGEPELLVYPGLAAAMLAMSGLCLRWQKSRFWLASALLFGLLSMGEWLPGASLVLARIPGGGWLRVPARFLFLSWLGLAISAGWGARALADLWPRRPRSWLLPALLSAWVILETGVLALAPPPSGAVSALTLLITIVLVAGVWLVWGGRWAAKRLQILWLAVLAVELALVNAAMLDVRTSRLEEEAAALINRIAEQGGGYRVFSPSLNLPPVEGVRAGLERADGVHPLILASYWGYMAEAVGYHASGYSVVLPPLTDGEPLKQGDFEPRTERLERLGVRYVVSAYPVGAEGLHLVGTEGDLFLYETQAWRPPAWVEPVAPEGDGNWQPAEVLSRSPNEIRVKASGPGELVFAEISYPGWLATVDGEEVPLDEAEGLLRSLPLEAGEHLVRLRYRPLRVYLGLAISLLTLLVCTLLWVKR